MNYSEAVAYIESTAWMGSRPGLERIGELCAALGDPQCGMRFVHVAGTNGKGSFCAMTASVLREAGYRTGLYTSPYVLRFNERMSIDGVDISDDELAELTTLVEPLIERMESKPTEFEIITAIAFEYFRRHGCDVVVLEVGMGGRLDATNIIEQPLLSVITGIALDHTAFLGDTVEKIAAEKAGVIKPGCPVHWGGRDEAAGRVIADIAAARGADFRAVDYSRLSNVRPTLDGTTFDFDGLRDLRISLLGLYQPQNAASVVAAVPLLRERGLDIDEAALRRGLAATRWPARFERLRTEPVVIYDGSHNPQGVRAAVDSIRGIFGERRVALLSGVLADKNYRQMADMLSEVGARAFCVTPPSPRALPARDWATQLTERGIPAEAYGDMRGALAAAYAYCRAGGTPLVALGSLYMYADFRAALDTLAE